MTTAAVPSKDVLSESGVRDPDYQQKIQDTVTDPNKITWAILLATVPLAFRLATMKLNGVPENEIGVAIEATASAFEKTISASLSWRRSPLL